MSDHYLRYIPDNPEFQPARGDAAAERLLRVGLRMTERVEWQGCYMSW
jgi:hypothetical protein